MIKLYKGDCLEIMKNIPDKSINLVLIDPPYNIKKAKWDKWKTVNEYVDFMGKVFLEIQRILKDNGSFYFFHNDFLQIVELQNYINKNTKFIFQSLLTWEKYQTNKQYYGRNVLMFVNAKEKRNYRNMAEHCLYYTLQDENNLTDEPPYCFKSYLDYMTSEKEKLNWDTKQFNDFLGYKAIASHWFYQDKNRKKQRQPRFISEKDYLKLKQTGCFQKEYRELKEEYESKRYTYNTFAKDITTTFLILPAVKEGHITPKPVELLEHIIKTSSNENDIVLDCFMGSGSTGVACKHTNRRFIGIELDDNYFEIAKKRIEEE